MSFLMFVSSSIPSPSLNQRLCSAPYFTVISFPELFFSEAPGGAGALVRSAGPGEAGRRAYLFTQGIYEVVNRRN